MKKNPPLVKPWAEYVYQLAANVKCGHFDFNSEFGFRKNGPKAEKPVNRERLKALINRRIYRYSLDFWF